MSDDSKDPQEQFKELIKSGVSAANNGLRLAQTTFLNFKEPISSTLQSIEENGAVASKNAKTIYMKRKQYAPEIMGGTAVATGGYLWLRRGRIAGVFGAVIGAGAAYSIVYDEFPTEFVDLPNVIFGKKDE
ncbi:unnamed protein product [Pseudo-nitzschia multistriata]|uniref:MICOS complex subunit n=1 Tax=Pseudo-nitzschia multistriata TaxID=183589 RepID=A0A448ZNS2_9STRA|nr:unnamed protein product [Pseudo-nitzschia multistriata]